MNDIYSDAAKLLGLNKNLVKKVYASYWLFIKSRLSEIDFNSIDTEDDFKKIQTSFSIPFFGKFYVDWKIVKHIKESIKNGSKINKTAVFDSNNNS